MRMHKITKWQIARNNFNEHGSIQTMKKIFVKGFFQPSQNYLNFVRKKERYAQNIIFITGLAKSGTTWIGNMFSSINGFDRFIPLEWHTYGPLDHKQLYHIDDLYPGIFEEFKNRLAVIKGHTWASPDNLEILKVSGLRYIITVRDPRDKLVSQYWYIRKRPNHWDHKVAVSKTLSEYITYQLESGEFERSIDWIRMWIKNRDTNKSIILRYEDVLSNTSLAIRSAVDFMGLRCTNDEIDKIVEAHTFEKYTGRKRGDEDTGSIYRKAVFGEWKEVLDGRQKRSFAKIGEDVIQFFAYEPTL